MFQFSSSSSRTPISSFKQLLQAHETSSQFSQKDWKDGQLFPSGYFNYDYEACQNGHTNLNKDQFSCLTSSNKLRHEENKQVDDNGIEIKKFATLADLFVQQGEDLFQSCKIGDSELQMLRKQQYIYTNHNRTRTISTGCMSANYGKTLDALRHKYTNTLHNMRGHNKSGLADGSETHAKIFRNSTQSLLQAFTVQLLGLCCIQACQNESRNSSNTNSYNNSATNIPNNANNGGLKWAQNYSKSNISDGKCKYLDAICQLLDKQQFELVFPSTYSQVAPHILHPHLQQQYKYLLLQFLSILVAQSKRQPQSSISCSNLALPFSLLSMYPRILPIFLSFLRGLLCLGDVCQYYDQIIDMETCYQFLASYFGIQAQIDTRNRCVWFMSTRSYVVMQDYQHVYLIYQQPQQNKKPKIQAIGMETNSSKSLASEQQQQYRQSQTNKGIKIDANINLNMETLSQQFSQIDAQQFSNILNNNVSSHHEPGRHNETQGQAQDNDINILVSNIDIVEIKEDQDHEDGTQNCIQFNGNPHAQKIVQSQVICYPTDINSNHKSKKKLSNYIENHDSFKDTLMLSPSSNNSKLMSVQQIMSKQAPPTSRFGHNYNPSIVEQHDIETNDKIGDSKKQISSPIIISAISTTQINTANPQGSLLAVQQSNQKQTATTSYNVFRKNSIKGIKGSLKQYMESPAMLQSQFVQTINFQQLKDNANFQSYKSKKILQHIQKQRQKISKQQQKQLEKETQPKNPRYAQCMNSQNKQGEVESIYENQDNSLKESKHNPNCHILSGCMPHASISTSAGVSKFDQFYSKTSQTFYTTQKCRQIQQQQDKQECGQIKMPILTNSANIRLQSKQSQVQQKQSLKPLYSLFSYSASTMLGYNYSTTITTPTPTTGMTGTGIAGVPYGTGKWVNKNITREHTNSFVMQCMAQPYKSSVRTTRDRARQTRNRVICGMNTDGWGNANSKYTKYDEYGTQTHNGIYSNKTNIQNIGIIANNKSRNMNNINAIMNINVDSYNSGNRDYCNIRI